MKKVFLLLATAVLALTACEKKNPVIPGGGGDDDPSGEGYKEKTFVVNVEIMKDVETSGWAAHPAQMPGAEILNFFDMTATEFYKGMGYCDDDAGATGVSSQKENTIMFGVANENNTDDLKWIPKTAANYGHWWSKTGRMTYWQDEANDKFFYTESVVEWGQESPDEETLAGMWTYNIGFLDGAFDGNIGDVYKTTEVFFITDDDDIERYAYVQWNIKIIPAQAKTFEVVGGQELTYTLDYDGGYLHTPFQDDINAAGIQSAIGIAMGDADVYAVDANGTFSATPGVNFWFDKEGNKCGWGEGCGIDLGSNEYPEGAPVWCICNFPDASLMGTTVFGTIAFVNPSTLKAYTVKVTVTFNAIEEVVPANPAAMHDAELNVYISVASTEGAADESIAEQILDAFQIGAEDVGKAILAGQISAKAYVNGVEADHNTADFEICGHWFDVNGNVIEFGNKVEGTDVNARSYYAGIDSDLTPFVGFYDSDWQGVNGKSIDSYKQEITFTYAESIATVTLNWAISFAIAATE